MSQRHYKVSARRWFTLDALELEYNGTKATFNGSRNVYAPAEYSYRCESLTSHRWPLLAPRTPKDPANQWRLVFEDFQVSFYFTITFLLVGNCPALISPPVPGPPLHRSRAST